MEGLKQQHLTAVWDDRSRATVTYEQHVMQIWLWASRNTAVERLQQREVPWEEFLHE